jgi:hypothetical protein
MKIGYAPYSPGLTDPGDRRRFPRYAAMKGLHFDLVDGVSNKYDVVILSSKADIAGWSSARRTRTKIVYELIDSQLALPSNSLQWNMLGIAKTLTRELSRPVLNYRNAIEAMCRRADAVICGCPEQKLQLQILNDRVHDILDFNEEIGGHPKDRYEVSNRPTLVWEGLSYSVKHLRLLAPVADQLNGAVEVRVITDPFVPRVGARYLKVPTREVLRRTFTDFDLRTWERGTMPDLVTEADIAVIPIDLSDPVARAKPENKLMLLWRLGMPVIASATPAYQRCMSTAGLDLTCESTSDWVIAIQKLLAEAGARRIAADAGRTYVNMNCDTAVLVQRWDQVLADVTDLGLS